MNTAFKILKGLLCLSLVVLIHEIGHTVACLLCGVAVTKFAVGLGPTLFETTLSNGTTFAIEAILFGGYTIPAATDIARATYGQRMFIDVAGMLASVLSTIPLLWGLFSVGKIPFGIDDEAPKGWKAFIVGILAPFALWLAWPVFIVKGFKKRTKKSAFELSGPIGMVREASSKNDFFKTLTEFSMVIAGMNLLPIPPLDGGHMMQRTIALLSPTAATWYAYAGAIVMIALLSKATANDLIRKRKTSSE